MHHTYIVPGVVDGAVAHKQAFSRLIDNRFPAETVVHAHREGEPCTSECEEYTFKLIESDETKEESDG